jgi:hypothetical protein
MLNGPGSASIDTAVAVGAVVAAGSTTTSVGTAVAVAAGGITIGTDVACGAQAVNKLTSSMRIIVFLILISPQRNLQNRVKNYFGN